MTGAFNNMNKGNVLIYFLYIHLMFYNKNTWSKALNQGYSWAWFFNIQNCCEWVTIPTHNESVTFPAYASTNLYTWVESSKSE